MPVYTKLTSSDNTTCPGTQSVLETFILNSQSSNNLNMCTHFILKVTLPYILNIKYQGSLRQDVI